MIMKKRGTREGMEEIKKGKGRVAKREIECRKHNEGASIVLYSMRVDVPLLSDNESHNKLCSFPFHRLSSK